MDEAYCSLCGMEIENKNPAYGITSGIIDEECCGFRMDSDLDWDLICPTCMNEIDKFLLQFKQSRAK